MIKISTRTRTVVSRRNELVCWYKVKRIAIAIAIAIAAKGK